MVRRTCSTIRSIESNAGPCCPVPHSHWGVNCGNGSKPQRILAFGLKHASDHVFLHRVLLHGDVRFNEALRGFVQFGYDNETARPHGPPATDVNKFDITLGFVDLSLPTALGPLVARAGRQELSFGSQRLVSVRESPNIRRSFDGGRVLWSADGYHLDAFYVRPVSVHHNAFDDTSNGAESLSGLYATGPVLGTAALKIDVYFFEYLRDAGRFAIGTARERRHSLGTRLFGRKGALDWNIEGVYQLGRFGPRDIKAWTLATDVGLNFDTVALKPQFGLKADIASGNRHVGQSSLGTFNALYPKLPYFSEANLIAPANVIDLHPDLRLQLAPALQVTIGWDLLWRETTRDAVYAPPLLPLPGTAGRPGHFIGRQAIGEVDWQLDQHLRLSTQYVHFFRGAALQSVHGRDVNFLYASITYKY